MSAVLTAPRPRNSRATLWLIVAVLALPFVLGAGLFLGGWQPAGKPHGAMVQPPQPLPAAMLRQTEALRGKWVLLLDAHDGCAAPCAQRLDEVRRVHVSLNKDMERLRRAVIDDPRGGTRGVLATQPDVSFVPATDAIGAGGLLYLVDPQGRIVLRYDPSIDAKAIRADLERLLRFAWNG